MPLKLLLLHASTSYSIVTSALQNIILQMTLKLKKHTRFKIGTLYELLALPRFILQ